MFDRWLRSGLRGVAIASKSRRTAAPGALLEAPARDLWSPNDTAAYLVIPLTVVPAECSLLRRDSQSRSTSSFHLISNLVGT